MSKAVLNKMFDNLLHIGNKSNYWSPKMKGYIYGSVNGIHVIDLTKTSSKIEEVKAELKELHANGKKILFVATKLQARDAISQLAIDSGHYFVSEKWVPGLLTNFKTIKKRIATYIQLSKDAETGALDVLTKKEKATRLLELEKLDKAYRWVKEMKKIPDVIFAIDGVFEEQAIKEANSLNLLAYAVLNTNWDDTVLTNCIPANTNSVKSIEYIANELKDALSGGVKSVAKVWNTWVKKIASTKVSGEKKATVKKEAPKKEVTTEVETETVTTEKK